MREIRSAELFPMERNHLLIAPITTELFTYLQNTIISIKDTIYTKELVTEHKPDQVQLNKALPTGGELLKKSPDLSLVSFSK